MPSGALAGFVLRAGNELDRRALALESALTTATIFALGVIDTATGQDLAFAIFYLVPVSLAACAGRRWLSVMSCVLAALTWLAADILAGASYSTPLVPAWNTSTRLGIFIVVASLLRALRNALLAAEELSRTDALTRVANPRHFYEVAERERSRAERTGASLSIVYLDLDNFKGVNDTAGHGAGDELLRQVGAALKGHVRVTDLVARLGGDEFAVLLPDTDAKAARRVAQKLHEYLRAALASHPGVGVSIGLAVFDVMPRNVDELLAAADRLMYEAKAHGKDGIRTSAHV